MDDRDFDRLLAQRLGDYEERVPVAGHPAFHHSPARGPRLGVMAAAFGVVAVGAVVGLVAAVTVFAPHEPNVASGPSFSPSPSASASPVIASIRPLPDPSVELAGVGWFEGVAQGVRVGTVEGGETFRAHTVGPSPVPTMPPCCGGPSSWDTGFPPWVVGPRGGVVAYVTDDGSVSRAHVVAAPGGADRVVFEDPETIISYGTLNPAGDELFFVRSDRITRVSLGIWRLRLDGGDVRQLAGTSATLAVHRRAPDGSQFAPIGREPRYEGLKVTPDGERLLGCGTRSGVAALLVIDLATGETRELLDVPDIYCPHGLTDTAAYYQSALPGSPNRWRTVEVDLTDGARRDVVDSLDWNISVIQDADGAPLLLHVTSTGSPYRVEALNLESGELATVVESPSNVRTLWPHHDPSGRGVFGVELPAGWFLLWPPFEDRETHPALAIRIADGASVEILTSED